MAKKKALGRGLSSFINDNNSFIVEKTNVGLDEIQESSIIFTPIENVIPNPDQPRKDFDSGDLTDLSETIKDKGILQPLIVVKDGTSRYKIVAGERRWRAAQLAQVHEIPVIVKELTSEEIVEIAIIENVQRAELSPLDEGEAYLSLAEKFKHKHEKIAKMVGKSRSYVSNLIRLISLPDEVKGYIRNGSLSSGHARALLNSDDPVGLAKAVIKKGLSVRQAEFFVKREKRNEIVTQKMKSFSSVKGPDTIELEQSLIAHLNMPIKISFDKKKKSGRLEISYGSTEELGFICGILKAKQTT